MLEGQPNEINEMRISEKIEFKDDCLRQCLAQIVYSANFTCRSAMFYPLSKVPLVSSINRYRTLCNFYVDIQYLII